jgi:hypothetical protein
MKVAGRLGLILSLLLPISAASAATPAHDAGALTVTVDWTPTTSKAEGAMWLAYLMARATYIEAHPSAYPQEIGVITPTFEEELEARSTVTTIYREMREKDKELDLAYFNDLAQVAEAAFLREYVWTFLRQPTWKKVPDGLRLKEFDAWKEGRLADHQVETKGRIRYDKANK